MKFICPYFDEAISFDEDNFNSIVIENQNAFRDIIGDIYLQVDCNSEGKCIVSESDKILNMSKICDIISSFAPFELNRKQLISGITSVLEDNAKNEVFYERTMRLIADIEKYAGEISGDLPCSISCAKLSVASVIKALGIEIFDDYENTAEKILDYLELMTEICHKRLFITVNMRSYFDDNTIGLFCDTVVSHKISLLMIEACSYPVLKNEKRITIDKDLCVF